MWSAQPARRMTASDTGIARIHAPVVTANRAPHPMTDPMQCDGWSIGTGIPGTAEAPTAARGPVAGMPP